MQKRRVLLFGESGSGKTTLCNAVTKMKRPANSGAKGVTFETFTYPEVTIGDLCLTLIDTAGLSEGDHGTVPSGKALRNLIRFVKSNSEGFNLVLFVKGSPRITGVDKDNVSLIKDVICQNKVPCILMRTKVENEERVTQWGKHNARAFEEEGMTFEAYLSGCFAEGGRLEPIFAQLRQESLDALYEAIQRHATREPVALYAANEFAVFLRRIWNAFCNFIGLTQFMVIADYTIKQLLLRLGCSETEVHEIANEM